MSKVYVDDYIASGEGVNGARSDVSSAINSGQTLTNADSERQLATMVFARLGAGESLGEAMVNAKQEYAIDNPNDLDVLLGWTLLGLPELRVN